jgi:hypothetical protein
VQIASSSNLASGLKAGVGVLLALLVCLAMATGAGAKEVELHNYDGVYPAGSFEGTDAVGAPKFPEGGLEKMDLDKVNGLIYVATESRFYKFNTAGVSQPFSAKDPDTTIAQQFGGFGDLEVDNSGTSSQGRIYAFAEGGPIQAYEPSGDKTSAPGFPISGTGDTCGAAVADNGNFLRNLYSTTIFEYDSQGTQLREFQTETGGYCDFDIDSQGNIYAPNPYFGGAVNKWSSTGVFQYVLDTGSSRSVAIDRSNDDVYVDVGNQINHYTSSGQFIESFGTAEGAYPGIVASRGITVNPVDHRVYANSNGSPTRVDSFASTGLITIADVSTEPATELTRTSAKLNGVLNPDDVTTTACKFEYALSDSEPFTNSVPCTEGNVFSGSSDVTVSAPVSALTGGTPYKYRLVVENAEGPSQGAVRTFTTVTAVKDTTALAPTNLTRTSATIRGSFDADGFETSYWFEWGEGCCTYPNKVPLPAPPGQNEGTPVGPHVVSQNISGLTRATGYHYRLVAKNSLGETKSEDVFFSTVGNVKDVKTLNPTAVTYSTATFHGELDPDGFATNFWFEYAKSGSNYEFKVPLPVPPGGDAGSTPGITEVSAPVTGLETGTGYYVRLVAENELGQTTSQQEVFFETQQAVNEVTTLPATDVTLTSATVHGSLNPDGTATTYYFEYGPSVAYGDYAPLAPPGALAGSEGGVKLLEAPLSELEPGVAYHYRLVGENVHGKSFGQDMTFTANDKPAILNDTVSQVNTDGAVIQAEINPNALNTNYYFEYGPEPCSSSTCTKSPSGTLFPILVPKGVSFQVNGLTPGETVYFRVVATNARGTLTGNDRKFTTYVADPGIDACANSQVRQQTGAALLLDCRAYELVSAANAGGYDVESDLVPGQEPLTAYPDAHDRVLYSIHNGLVPGVAGRPTNYGRDPYVATRDATTGWSTSYVGLPANGMTQFGAFGSPLLGSDSQLSVFAFGGTGICDPCFSDGTTNVPLRLASGEIVKGMAGGANPAADRSQYVAKPFSADGSHFIFGSDGVFATGGQVEGTIYARDLSTDATQVVSTLADGSTIAGGDVGALDVSADGSRIVVGKEVSTDAEGNRYWHPYMHIGTSPNSVPLAPGSTSGVLYAGMTEDGQETYFTTVDKLVPADIDTSADLYRSAVGPAGGPAVLDLVSGGSNPEACDPAANTAGNNWNGVGSASADDCGVIPVAGGAGVAAVAGTVFFLSPEELSGEGEGDQPNLFVADAGGSPRLVATLEPDNPLVLDSVADNEVHRYADLQVTKTGEFAVFDSDLDLTEFPSQGHTQIYRFEVPAAALICATCAPSGAAPTQDSELGDYGSAVTDDGRVFFTSAESFVLRDTNEVKDAYEYSDIGPNPITQLISTGTSLEASGMLSVTPEGKDAFFFTRQVLVNSDGNGGTVKVYDAREGGGFLYDPSPHPCAASDECHGAGSASPGPPNINTQTGSGVTPPVAKTPKPCKKGFKKNKKGKCVKKRPKHKKHKKSNSTKRRG